MISLKLPNEGLSPPFGIVEKICLVPFDFPSVYFYLSMLPAPLHTSKRLDLLPDDINTSIIASVEFKNHLSYIFTAIYSPGER